jgi:hypothetical protein
MTVTWNQVAADFAQLRDFLERDVRLITESETGGNYAAVAVIMCGYEALGKLRGEHARATFARSLPADWRPVAASLYDALRNGIAHGYDTKLIVTPGRTVEIAVSWRRRVHLSWHGDQLNVNVQALGEGLRCTLCAFERALRQDPARRDQFFEGRREGRRAELHPGNPELCAWPRLMP